MKIYRVQLNEFGDHKVYEYFSEEAAKKAVKEINKWAKDCNLQIRAKLIKP